MNKTITTEHRKILKCITGIDEVSIKILCIRSELPIGTVGPIVEDLLRWRCLESYSGKLSLTNIGVDLLSSGADEIPHDLYERMQERAKTERSVKIRKPGEAASIYKSKVKDKKR